ncbi:hypothetical protein C4D60_Mb11t05690 [Musa balbisiana]|uniref:RNA helicase n=1 Tax=Musa balbisiana TaxID=52838 RepID=A0A4S8J244_MUSBA|nr:hypothetical protein C4D60_Mb11t05690 [Musa balbisiana]
MGRVLDDDMAPSIDREILHVAMEEENKKKKNKKKNKEFENGEALTLTPDSPENGGEEHMNGTKKKKKKKRKIVEAELDSSSKNSGTLGNDSEKTKKKKKREGEQGATSKEEPALDSRRERKQVEEGGTQGEGAEAGEGGGVIVSGNNTSDPKYKALSSFAESGLPAKVLDCCKNFSRPSPIQSHAWPFLLEGRDFIGIAATGSGKTLAFGVPALMHILKIKSEKTSKKTVPRCLVLSPTRELAQQIEDVLSDAATLPGIKSVCLYGGTSKGPQISSLKSGVDIVIGTPGRMKDLIEMGVCQLKDVSFVVLDEADRMLDMGFEPEVRSILNQTSSVRQMVMFSATWPVAVDQLAREFMDPNPVKVVVGSEDLSANHDVMQIVEVLEDRQRDSRLVALLEKYHQSQRNRVLVFVLYKKEAARVENMLQRRGWKAVSVHGDKAQHDRTKALCLFKEGKCPLMGLAGELVNVLREAGQTVPTALTNFGTHVKKKESKLYGSHFKEITGDAPKSTKITFTNSDDED